MLAQGLKDLRTSNANARAAASKRDAAATSGEPTGTAAAPAASTSGSRLAPMASTPGAARDPRTAPHAPSAAAAEGPGGRAKAGSGTEAAGNGAPGARVSGYAGQGQMDNSSMAVGGDSQNVDPPRKPGGVQSLRSDDAVVDRVRAASSGEKVEDKGGR